MAGPAVRDAHVLDSVELLGLLVVGHNAEGQGAAAHEPMLVMCYDHWSLLDPNMLFKYPINNQPQPQPTGICLFLVMFLFYLSHPCIPL
jgi:hypothetical protein